MPENRVSPKGDGVARRAAEIARLVMALTVPAAGEHAIGEARSPGLRTLLITVQAESTIPYGGRERLLRTIDSGRTVRGKAFAYHVAIAAVDLVAQAPTLPPSTTRTGSMGSSGSRRFPGGPADATARAMA